MPKISALPPAGSLADDDETPFVDDSVGSTKKFSLSGLKTWLQSLASWVTTAMLANNAVTSTKLTAALLSPQASTGDLSTSYVSTGSLNVPAGTWLLISTGFGVFSVAQYTQITGRLRNVTDGTDELANQTFAGSYVSGTISARPAVCMAAVVTFASTKQIDAQFVLNTGSGSGSVTGNLIAIPVGV